MSIRNYSIGIAAMMCGIVILATAEMYGATRLIEHTSNVLFNASEGLRIAADTQRYLRDYNRAARNYARSGDALHAAERDAARRQLTENLLAARNYVDTPGEGIVLDRIERQVKALLEAEPQTLSASGMTQPEREQNESIGNSIEALVRINETQAIDAQRTSVRTTHLASIWATVLGIALLIASIGIIVFMLWNVCAPLQSLRNSIVTYKPGAEPVRAPANGPSEIADVAQAFNLLAERLEMHRQLQQTFLAGIAHDMLNPLNAMKLALTASDTQQDRLPPEFWKRMPALLNRQLSGLQHLVSDLLDLTLLERGRLKIDLRRNDLCRIVRHVLELFQSASSKHKISLRAPAEPLELECDETRIQQVVGNLIQNAIKYSPEGGTIDVSIEHPDGNAILTVADEGIGISPDDQQHLFEPFCRGGDTSAMIPGIGLGLSIARSLVLAHGGRIEVTSQIGAGSAFRVILPLAAPVAFQH